MIAAQNRGTMTLLAALALLALFAFTAAPLDRDSLWADEAWTAWASRAPALGETLARVRADVHPPLYFLLLHGWTLAAGDSVYALRLPSALFGLIGLAATFAVGARLFDRRAGLLALVILGASSFFVYYTREARMYSLLLALAALSTWAYLRWSARPGAGRLLVYAGLLAALLYTHYAGALVLAAQALHRLLTQPRPLRRTALPYALALALFAPWTPALLEQMRANPHGPLALPVPADWGAVAGLVLILTGGGWALMLLPFALGDALPRLRRYRRAVLLLALWLLLTPAILLALNAWVAPVYQVRYTIAMLPAAALLLAYGLWRMRLPRLGAWHRLPLQAALLLALAAGQIAAYPALWPAKPPWETAARRMIAARDPLEPTITDLAAYSPAAYYDRRLGIRQGVSLDLSWRLHPAEELRRLPALFDGAPSVWVALPVNTAKTWHLTAMLDADRGAGYRSGLGNMIFYRFDRDAGADLAFRFGDRLRYLDGPGAAQQFDLRAGDRLCAGFGFAALSRLDGQYSAGLHLVDITGSASAAQHDEGLGAHDSGAALDFAACLVIPPGTPPGYYHLELAVYDWSTGERLPVIEDGAGGGVESEVHWGDVMRLAAVNVSE